MFPRAMQSFLIALVSGMAFAAGLIASRLGFHAVGFSVPRMPAQARESIAGFYLLAGSVILSAGLVSLAKGLGGSRAARWLVLAVFLFCAFAASTTVENSIFSNVAGTRSMIRVFVLPCLLLAAVLAWSSSSRPLAEATMRRISQYVRARRGQDWAWRIAAAIVSFPLIYLALGVIVSPVVSEYYAIGIAGLALPAPTLIIKVQFLRSALHLVSAAPLIFLWTGRRRQLVTALTQAFFVFVFSYDFVLANQVPIVLVLVHGVEVLVGSFCYAQVLATLLMPPWTQRAEAV